MEDPRDAPTRCSFCYHRRRTVVLAWVVGIVLLGSVLGAVGSGYKSDFTLPDVESKRGIDILDAELGGQGVGQTGTIVFRSEQPVDDPGGAHGRRGVPGRPRRRARPAIGEQSLRVGQRGPDRRGGDDAGHIAYADIEAPSDATFEETVEIGRQIREAIPSVDGLQIEVGGAAFAEFEVPSSEALGLGFAIIILIVAFGSVLAMGLPIGVALAGIVSGTLVTGLLSQVVSMPDFASTLGIMIGLGVGIDYALLIVTRFRENLHKGHSIESSTLVAHGHRRTFGAVRRHDGRHLDARHADHAARVHLRAGHRRRWS